MPNLFIDIETCPDHSRLYLFDLPQPPETLPAPADLLANTLPVIESFLKQYGPCLSGPFLDSLEAAESRAAKPRSSVTQYVSVAREAVARQRTDLSITPEFCRVVALGWAEGDSDPEATVIGPADDERSILQGFWSLVSYQKPTVIGFNILDFDLRVLMIRSALLGVKPSRLFDLKPWGRDCIDLVNYPRLKARGLFPDAPTTTLRLELSIATGVGMYGWFTAALRPIMTAAFESAGAKYPQPTQRKVS